MTTDSQAPDASQHRLWCTDCRAPLRAHYFALDERPVCGNCRGAYAAKIARGEGPQAMWRAVAYGLGGALAGAALIGFVTQVFGFGRILCAIAIGWMVAMAINHATGEYFGRRYRILAVALTYFAVGLGSLSPIVIAVWRLPDEAVAEAPADEMDLLADASDDAGEFADEVSAEEFILAEGNELMEDMNHPPQPGSHEQQIAEDLVEMRPHEVALALLTFLLTLPLLSIFAYGIHGAVVGVLAFGYGMYKAWELTGKGVAYTLSGPYRVGQGPIPPAL